MRNFFAWAVLGISLGFVLCAEVGMLVAGFVVVPIRSALASDTAAGYVGLSLRLGIPLLIALACIVLRRKDAIYQGARVE